jgi:hypothetical protein
MKTDTLEGYYNKAVSMLGDSDYSKPAAIIIDLVDEVRRLRLLHTKRKAQRNESLDDDCEMTVGKEYRGERLADVPLDYLIWLKKEMNMDHLKLEAQFGADDVKFWAKKRLRLYNYIMDRIDIETIPEPEELEEPEEQNEQNQDILVVGITAINASDSVRQHTLAGCQPDESDVDRSEPTESL